MNRREHPQHVRQVEDVCHLCQLLGHEPEQRGEERGHEEDGVPDPELEGEEGEDAASEQELQELVQ